MSDRDPAVKTFLAASKKVYSEYENGYMDADAALDLLSTHIEELEENTGE